jgi:hypothetical protein
MSQTLLKRFRLENVSTFFLIFLNIGKTKLGVFRLQPARGRFFFIRINIHFIKINSDRSCLFVKCVKSDAYRCENMNVAQPNRKKYRMGFINCEDFAKFTVYQMSKNTTKSE